MSTGNSTMIPVVGSGWTRGLDNTLRGELKSWFAKRRWWVQILIWTVVINLVFLAAPVSSGSEQGKLETPLLLFNIILGMFGPISICIIMQSAVVGEKRSGTAAWVLSKPVSRSAFILSKLIANATGIAVTRVLPQGMIAYLITALVLKVTLPPAGFLAALGVHLLNILFYLTLTLMLGVLFEKPGPVIGIPLAVLLAQNFLMSFYPRLAAVLPWTLTIPANNEQYPSIAMNLMTGAHVPSFVPVFTALGAAVLFVAIALWVFEKQEL